MTELGADGSQSQIPSDELCVERTALVNMRPSGGEMNASFEAIHYNPQRDVRN